MATTSMELTMDVGLTVSHSHLWEGLPEYLLAAFDFIQRRAICPIGNYNLTDGLQSLKHIRMVLALLFLSLIPWPGPPVFKISCSRDNAKLVRKIVQSKWIPLLEKYQVKLPLECPFHPLRDIFGPQHAAKLQHRPSQWTCGFCGKSFYEERFLDAHFDQRHKHHINKAEDAVCLADYCDIMRCQVLISQEASLEPGEASSTDVELWKDAAAVRSALAPAAPRHVARVPAAGGAREQHPRRREQTQKNENCPKQVEPDPESEDDERVEGEDGEGEANHTSELCDADTVESALPPVDTRHQRLADIQRLKASCDPEHLQTLKVRCEQLVHDCIATLLLHLTTQHFKEIEEEMKRAVCWYLSCDRYWQDAVTSVRAFPWPLVLAATTLLTLAVCMCYYIIWIVFDSEEGSVAGSASASMTAHSSPSRAADSRLAGGDDPLDPGDGDPNDHYIYVTYPPDLKRRLLESCYNRTTRL